MQKTYTENQLVEMGRRIAARRKACGMTQLELAEKLDISNNHLSGIETGTSKPSFDVFLQLCELLETTPNHLVLGCMFPKNLQQNTIDTIRLLDDENTQLIYDYVNMIYARQLSKLLK